MRAAATSIERMRAWATLLRRKAACSMQGSSTSSTNSAWPLSSRASSLRVMGAPKLRVVIRSTPQPFGGKHHGLDDMLVTGAAAEVAGQRLANLRLIWGRPFVEETLHGHQDAGRAIAALQPVTVAHRFLQRMEMVAVGGEPLDGHDRVAVRLCREHQTGANRNAVEDHGAGTAYAVLATDMRTREQEIVPQEVAEQHARFDLAPVLRTVHRNGYVMHVTGHAALFRLPRRARAWSARRRDAVGIPCWRGCCRPDRWPAAPICPLRRFAPRRLAGRRARRQRLGPGTVCRRRCKGRSALRHIVHRRRCAPCTPRR